MSSISDVWVTHDDLSYECGECHSIFLYPYEDCPTCGCEKSYVFIQFCCQEIPINEYTEILWIIDMEKKYNKK